MSIKSKILLAVGCAATLVGNSSTPLASASEPPIAILPVASLLLHEQSGPFRAVALDLPNVYAVDLFGGVYSFKIDPQKQSQTVGVCEFVQTKSTGRAIHLYGDSLLIPRYGELYRFKLQDLRGATPSSVVGRPQKWPSRAIVEGQSQLFQLEPYRVSSYQLDGLDADPRLTSTFESEEIWWCGSVRGQFLNTSMTRPADRFIGITILEIGEDGKLQRRGELRTEGVIYGVHACADQRLALVHGPDVNQITMVDASNPDEPLRIQQFEFPTTKASVIARVHDREVLVTGLEGAVIDGAQLIHVAYPYQAAETLGGECYFGDVQEDWVAIPADHEIHVVRIVPH